MKARSLLAFGALVFVLGAAGTGSAALARNTVGSAQIINHSIKAVDLGTDVLQGSRCKWGPKTGRTYFFRPTFNPATNPGFIATSVWCVIPDRFEPNNSSAAAANLLGATGEIGVSMYPAGNDDWFVNQVTTRYIYVCPYAGTRPTTVQIFRNGSLVTLGASGSCAYYDNGSAQNATWAIHTDGAVSLYYLYFQA